jgi:carboxyl-terminal processing protease
MPRRNLLVLFLVMLAASLCRQRVENRYTRVLGNAMNTIENRALDPVGDENLFEGAMYGMLSQFDKPTMYLSPENLAELNEALDLQFGGIGIKVIADPKTKQLIVGYPVANSPASRAGIVVGDKILRIDKTTTRGMSLPDASALLRGVPQTTVTLSVLHPAAAKPVDIPLVREEIQGQSVLGDTCNPDGSWNYLLEGHDRIGYLRISCFTDETPKELRKAVDWLKSQGMRGLVLDLRDDPGGYLPAAVAVCNLFITSGEIVTTRGRKGVVSDSFRADGAAPFADIPLAVIVNQDTASAAEIVAACLQDHGRAAIVGQRSYGKGTVQELINLEPGCGGMKLTTKSYWRPSGKDIRKPPGATAKDEWGVSPDKDGKVVLGKSEFNRWQAWRIARDLHQPALDEAADKKDAKPFVDRQLQRAVECVEKKS